MKRVKTDCRRTASQKPSRRESLVPFASESCAASQTHHLVFTCSILVPPFWWVFERETRRNDVPLNQQKPTETNRNQQKPTETNRNQQKPTKSIFSREPPFFGWFLEEKPESLHPPGRWAITKLVFFGVSFVIIPRLGVFCFRQPSGST